MSRRRRGWPFGIEASKMISPSKPVSSAIVSASSRIEISAPVPMFTGSRARVALAGEHERIGGVLDVEELARRRAVAQSTTSSVPATILRISAGTTCEV